MHGNDQVPVPEKFFGKYRAIVVDNADPEGLGRICARPAAMPSVEFSWAMPCFPYAGFQVGFFNVPPIDASVWIEFEGGDIGRPIWSGCFWGPEDAIEQAHDPLMHVWKTSFMTITINDTPEIGGITITCLPDAVDTPLTMVFNSTGITIEAPPAIIKMVVEEGITLEYPPDTIAMTEAAIEVSIAETSLTLTEEATELESPAISLTAELDISAEAGGGIEANATGEIEIAAGGDLSLTAGLAAEITSGAEMAITSALALEVTATAIEITGATNVSPALTEDFMPVMVLP